MRLPAAEPDESSISDGGCSDSSDATDQPDRSRKRSDDLCNVLIARLVARSPIFVP